MSVMYQLAVSPHQAESFLEHGVDFFGGFGVDAAEVTSLNDVEELIALFHCDMAGSPFAVDQPIDILKVPAGPFVQARHAVGPQHPEAFLGGVIEFPPFDGSGTVTAGGVSTDLLWIEPARLTEGSQLWRFYPGIAEPELMGVYHGIAWGWETVKTGTFTACIPSQFLGPVTLRSFGLAPVDVELDESGTQPAALTIVAPAEPPDEGGFEELPTGLWAKRIEFHEGLDIFEYQVQGRYHTIPVRVTRRVSGAPGTDAPAAQVCAVLLDTPAAAAAEFDRYAQALHMAVAPFEDIEDQVAREARPGSWDVSERPAISIRPSREHSATDTQSLVTDILSLLGAVAPIGWESIQYLVQLVDKEVNYSAAAFRSSEDTGQETQTIRVVPTAILHYMNQIKLNMAKPGEGAPFSMLFTFQQDGNAGLTLNFTDAPPWSSSVSPVSWRAELAAFPRDEDHIPEWLRSIVEGTDA